MSSSNPHNSNVVEDFYRKPKSTTYHTETKTITDDNVTESEVVKTITDYYTDGSTHVRKEVHSIKEETVHHLLGPQQKEGTLKPNPQIPGSDPTEKLKKDGKMSKLSNRKFVGLEANLPRSAIKTDQVFIGDCLAAHNKYRSKHGVPPVIVDNDLCEIAQYWADKLAELGVMQNSHFGYGENIYWTNSATGRSIGGNVPVDYWYFEETKFDWTNPEFQKTTGSFTQIIWKDSKEIGVAKSSSGKGTFVVVFYNPAGNVLGHFSENVFKN